jgi:type IV pilus assembly protein PilA
VTTLLNATYQYSIDNNGVLPASITATATEICATTGAGPCAGMIDLGVITVNQKYVIAIPTDPQKVTVGGSGYTITKTPNGRLTVAAPLAEQSAVITVSK